MDTEDKLAAATLAAARCAILGQHDVEAYFKQYLEFEQLFKQHRTAETSGRVDKQMDSLDKINRQPR